MKWEMAVPWMLTLATASVGIWQFTTQQAQASRRPFLEQQLEICIEASDVAASLATETDPEEWKKHRDAFWRLYWGRLALVENRAVEAQIVQFGRLVPKGPEAPAELPVTALQEPSLHLAHAARQLILDSWDVDLPPLAGEREP